ncbi:MAG: 4Fe-4S dicluster domain-containing protein [Bacillota bacterium]
MAARYGMVLDLRKCIGCDACVVACKMENEVVRGKWRTYVHEKDIGEYPQVTKIKLPTLCNHCEDPPCVKACPVGATYVNDNGVVLVNNRCIGCGYCITACPYDERFKDSVKNVVDKCTYCYHRVEVGLMPACVSNCVSHCRVFGDLDDPGGYLSRYIKDNHAVNVAQTSTYYVLPEGIERAVIPADLERPALIYLWKNIIHGLGKAVLGLAAGAVVAGTIINTVKGGDKHNE